ncbi:Crp/Fnr family transcriptional regulator [Sphingomonas solaris]|uniref:Crp/Fnr family transcriptional regulator n=1 Tax=Alterirhizorhabdus solaris TaxID=2529389 RepID=A0A558RAC6_9SPHN|nr:Crp/Fnr family transcriptional regulator [Sphingomonas solaris]TVV76324.1 Crp/Fnr family transcriptional regulator [Sphingomonas solaris]
MTRESSLVARLSGYMDLTAAERDALDWAERREVTLKASEVLLREGSENDMLFIVQSGWLFSSTMLPNGSRQILRFHFPGDVMGTSGIAWLPAVHSLTAVSDCVVAELTRANFARLFREKPRLAGLFYAVAAAEGVALCDRLTSVARLDAMQRVGTLLLDILARLRVTSIGVVRSFDLPLTQTDIGDAVGLTKVHVNRVLGRLEEQGYIERNGRRVTIANEDRLVELTGFVDRYAVVETNWIIEADDRSAATIQPSSGNLDHNSIAFS